MKKFITNIPDELDKKIEIVKDKTMLCKTSIMKIAINQFCDKIIKGADRYGTKSK